MRVRKASLLIILVTVFVMLAICNTNIMKFRITPYSEPCTCQDNEMTTEVSIQPKTSISMVETTLGSLTTSYSFQPLNQTSFPVCRGNVYLQIIVVSKKSNKNGREKMRRSYGSLRMISQHNVNTLFYVHLDNKDPNVHKDLLNESKTYRDIYYSNIGETEDNLLALYIELFRIAVRCNAEYFLVVYDNTFVNIPAIINVTTNFNISLMCNTFENNPVIRNEKSIYYVSKEVYPDNSFPPHCRRYSPLLISGDYARKLAKGEKKSKVLFHDVYLFGILPKMLNISVEEFPKYLSPKDMRPNSAISGDSYGFLLNGEMLPTRLWVQVMIKMLIKGTPKM